MNICLTTCRTCCKFLEEDIYFAPKVTKKEIDKIKSSGFYKQVFNEFKNSKKVFQINLSRSKLFKDVFVCPYLNEKTQVCSIYTIKPFDCEFWPFILMYDEKKENILIAHFNKNICKITKEMSGFKFNNYLKINLNKLIKEKNVKKLIREYPALVWDYEPDMIVLDTLKLD